MAWFLFSPFCLRYSILASSFFKTNSLIMSKLRHPKRYKQLKHVRILNNRQRFQFITNSKSYITQIRTIHVQVNHLTTVYASVNDRISCENVSCSNALHGDKYCMMNTSGSRYIKLTCSLILNIIKSPRLKYLSNCDGKVHGTY